MSKYIACAEALQILQVTRQRLERLCRDGKVRRVMDTDRPRWLYHAGDLEQHCKSAKPGRPRKDKTD